MGSDPWMSTICLLVVSMASHVMTTKSISACESHPCMNGGCCYDTSHGYGCVCFGNHEGSRCETMSMASQVMTTQSINACESHPCMNGGCCYDTSPGYGCVCFGNYEGRRCESMLMVTEDIWQACQNFPCMNGGDCDAGSEGFICYCMRGYTGRRCETVLDICASNPCWNGGTCEVQWYGGYTCYCEGLFTGQHCDTHISACESHPCKNGGCCYDTSQGYGCICFGDYEGSKCETNIDECASNPCQNNATCVDKVNTYQCRCLDGYVGRRFEVKGVMCYMCSYARTADTNEYTRECLTAPKATPCPYPRYCTSVWQFDSFLPTPKTNIGKGDIRSFVRMCDTVNRGNYCVKETNLQLQTCCSTCRKDKCNDGDGSLIKGCDYNLCQNGATCNDDNGPYTCECMKGFTGKNCETDFDKCASNPCQNNATCMDKVNAYKCLCLDGYAGRRCEVKGVMCYTCSYVWSADTANTRECVYDPEQVTIGTKATPCSYPRYCTTIKRVDYQLPTPKNSNQTKGGDIWSFVRMCDTVNRGNKCLKDVKAQSETCYSTCRENYCNNGDGSKITGISGSSTVTMSYVLVGLFARIAFINM